MTVTSERSSLSIHRRRLVLVTAAAFVVDLATKALASTLLADRSVHIAGPFQLRLVHNPGVAFGLGEAAPAWLILVLTGSVAAVVAIAAWRGHFGGSALAAGFVLGGAVANLVDRLEAGTVVDMFDVGWWPTFNVADIGITIGVGLLALTTRAGQGVES